MTFIYDICRSKTKNHIYMNTHTGKTRDIGDKIEFLHLYMLEHMLFLYAPTPCGKRTCSAFTEFCRTSESNLRLAASWCFEKHGSESRNLENWLSHLDFADCFSGMFFLDAKIPGIDCS